MTASYRARVREFVRDAKERRLEPLLAATMAREHSPASDAERASWNASLFALAVVLEADRELLDADVFVEFSMPLSARRCDVMFTGRNRLGEATAVIMELKQWTAVQSGPYPEHVRVGHEVRLHPSHQVKGYVTHLRNFHTAFDRSRTDAVHLYGCAWLHGLTNGPALTLLREPSTWGPVIEDYRCFGGRDVEVMLQWLRAHLLPGPSSDVTERVEAGEAAPSQKLLDLVVSTIEKRHEWNLLDVQRTVYWAIRDAVQKAKDTGTKKVILVRGGPGTGKSVLAIQLLADAARQDWRVVHATGSKAFQTVLQGQTLEIANPMLKRLFGARYKRELPVQSLFTTFADVAKASVVAKNRMDLVVGDEAHRLWKHRRIKYPSGKVEWLSDTPMIAEVIDASLVTAFFLDDNQSVRSGEVGRSDLIEQQAREMGIDVERFELDAQFRCAGSESYVRWVEGLVGHVPGNDQSWIRDHVYDFVLAPDAAAVAARLELARQLGHRCRMLAGYCWRWSKPTPIGELPHDLKDPRFNGWSGAWIEKTGQHLQPEQNQYYLWATQESHAEQVGSIYSAQGFEFDYVGLIWGEDLVRRGDTWVAQLQHNKDAAFKKELAQSGADPVAMLSNVYRVLLTRGMRGTALTVLDEETREYVQARLVSYASKAVGGSR